VTIYHVSSSGISAKTVSRAVFATGSAIRDDGQWCAAGTSLHGSYCNSYFLFRIVVIDLVHRQFFNGQSMQESGGCENISIRFDLDVFGAKSLCEKPPRGVGSEPPIILSRFAAHAFVCDSGNCHKNDPSEFQNTHQ